MTAATLLQLAGRCSWFGGPDDEGVSPSEGLAFIYEYDQAPYLFLDQQPPGTTGLARRLNPDVFYIACRWDYGVTPKELLRESGYRALVRAGDKAFLAWPADWGPHEDTGRVADISLGLMEALDIETDDVIEVIYPAPEEDTDMTTPKRMVLDLSHHNTVDDWNQMVSAGIIGMIHKASEGDYMSDDKYPGRRDGCAESGLCWGAYHFATNDPVEAQVELFLSAAQPDDDTLMVLDWEPYGSKQMTVEQAKQWIEMVEERTGRPGEVMIYSGNLAKEELGSSDTFFGERRLWLAQYGSSPSVEPPWDEYWLWQYSDGDVGPEPKGCPGCGGYVDTNSFDGTESELRAEWASGSAERPKPPRPPRPPQPVEGVVNMAVIIRAPEGVTVNVHVEQIPAWTRRSG